jgi:hypothetical protein
MTREQNMAGVPRKNRGFFRIVRTGVLLFILLAVAGQTYLTRLRTTDWDDPLWVSVYPINADGSPVTARYIAALNDESFTAIERFIRDEAQKYGVTLERPMVVRLAPEVKELPPEPPSDGNRLGVMWWSLKMRYWAWSTQNQYGGPPANITMFVKYHDPANTQRLAHSLGLQKGLLGVVNAFASRKQRGENQVVIAHELLHTLGATDKYDMQSLQPVYPEGFAEPDRQPRYPQRFAELMGGRIPLGPDRAKIPPSLRYALVGDQSAREIGWIQ